MPSIVLLPQVAGGSCTSSLGAPASLLPAAPASPATPPEPTLPALPLSSEASSSWLLQAGAAAARPTAATSNSEPSDRVECSRRRGFMVLAPSAEPVSLALALYRSGAPG